MGFGMLGLFGSLLLLVFAAVIAALAMTAYVNDVIARRWVWLIGECLFPPIAIVRGLMIWFDEPHRNAAAGQGGGSDGREAAGSTRPGQRELAGSRRRPDAGPPDRR